MGATRPDVKPRSRIHAVDGHDPCRPERHHRQRPLEHEPHPKPRTTAGPAAASDQPEAPSAAGTRSSTGGSRQGHGQVHDLVGKVVGDVGADRVHGPQELEGEASELHAVLEHLVDPAERQVADQHQHDVYRRRRRVHPCRPRGRRRSGRPSTTRRGRSGIRIAPIIQMTLATRYGASRQGCIRKSVGAAPDPPLTRRPPETRSGCTSSIGGSLHGQVRPQ